MNFLFFFIILTFLPISLWAEDILYDSGGRRDPFIPLVGPDGIDPDAFDPSGLKVEGIIFDRQNGSLALINGDFYKEGESVQSAKLITIFKDRVVLAQNDEQKTLWLREEILEGDQKKHERSSDAAPQA